MRSIADAIEAILLECDHTVPEKEVAGHLAMVMLTMMQHFKANSHSPKCDGRDKVCAVLEDAYVAFNNIEDGIYDDGHNPYKGMTTESALSMFDFVRGNNGFYYGKHYTVIHAGRYWALWNTSVSYRIETFTRLKDLCRYLQTHKSGEHA